MDNLMYDPMGVDKLMHAVVSFFVALCMMGCFLSSRKISGGVALLAVMVLFFPIGIIKELMDSYEPNNFFDVLDIIANYFGAILGCLLAAIGEANSSTSTYRTRYY